MSFNRPPQLEAKHFLLIRGPRIRALEHDGHSGRAATLDISQQLIDVAGCLSAAGKGSSL
jgi:hypothetical protein